MTPPEWRVHNQAALPVALESGPVGPLLAELGLFDSFRDQRRLNVAGNDV